jgi:hypothetical protein
MFTSAAAALKHKFAKPEAKPHVLAEANKEFAASGLGPDDDVHEGF